MSTRETRMFGLDRAITEAGGIVAFRKDMGITHQAVYCWKKKGVVPMDRAAEIERRYGIPAINIADPKRVIAARRVLGVGV
jgi:hypothetical protein